MEMTFTRQHRQLSLTAAMLYWDVLNSGNKFERYGDYGYLEDYISITNNAICTFGLLFGHRLFARRHLDDISIILNEIVTLDENEQMATAQWILIISHKMQTIEYLFRDCCQGVQGALICQYINEL